MILEDAPLQTIGLSGISAGPNETQPLQILVTSGNIDLIPAGSISINYISPDAIGSISYTPAANKSGTAEITVTVKDDGTSNNTIQRKS